MQETLVKIDVFDQQDNLRVVDALRGYAILLVIGCHTTAHIRYLVWPAKRFLLIGTYGVQLFFMTSALTLLMSWARGRDSFGIRSAKFFIRRFFRIAPLYFLAIAFYWLVDRRTTSDFSFDLLAASMFFYNAWSPYLIPTVNLWQPVPGGWSIGVEFCFYFIFPLLAVFVTTTRRSLIFIAIGLLVLITASAIGMHMYAEIGAEERWNFLYFWPPNQLIIFAFGFLLYQFAKSDSIAQKIVHSKITADKATAILAAAIFALSLYGQRKFFEWPFGLPPTHLLISIAFLAWALVLLNKPDGLTVNSMIVSLGKVSFSAYVLHFAALKLTDAIFTLIWPLQPVGIMSVINAIAFFAIALSLTWYASSITYKYIEQPFINLGKRLIATAYSQH